MADTARIDPRDVGTPDDWIERHPELIRLTGRHPLNCEPPLAHLQTFLTPTPLHFVRNHGPVPKMDAEAHELEISGLVDRPSRFSMAQLKDMFADSVVTFPVLLVCSGNRRKEQNMIKQSIGFGWGAGAASTSEYTGVPLHVVLSYCGINRDSGRYVWFEGADSPPHESYGTCVPMHTAMDPSCDILLAWNMNGGPLTPDHGFPLRVVVPGHVAGRMVKWLARIHVSDHESMNYHHLHDNRLMPSHLDIETVNRENWWVRPEYVINELNINSIVYAPAHDEELTVAGSSFDDPDQVYRVRGYAYTGGGRRITRVEITLDDGANWELAEIRYDEKPNRAGKMWCWVHYELAVSMARLVRADEICVRAWDKSMNTQPEFPTWNLTGMMNNPWFRVKIHGSPHGSNESKLVFEHPTQAGNLKGGWMTRGARPGPSKKTVAEAKPAKQIEDRPAQAAAVNENDHSALPLISREEVARHASKSSCWFICRGLVYDVTPYLSDHPGGAASILLCGGTDCTDEFESIHSTRAWQMLEKYCIGRCPSDANDAETTTNGKQNRTLSDPVTSDTDSDSDSDVALQGPVRVPLVLVEKQMVSRSARIFKFALPRKNQRLGLPVGNHVLLYARIGGKTIVRAYTPISDDEGTGFVSFLIKVYMAGENPVYPEGGLFTQHLDQLHLGAQIEMKGPLGHFTYMGAGAYLLDHGTIEPEANHARKFGLIAGGTGITPMFQIMRAILTAPNDCTEIALLYCVPQEPDLLLRQELEALQRLKPGKCRVYFTLTDSDRVQSEPRQSELDAAHSGPRPSERDSSSEPKARGWGFKMKYPMPVAPKAMTWANAIRAKYTRPPRTWSYGRTRITPAMIKDVIGADASHVVMCGPQGMIDEACIPVLEELGYSRKTQLTVL